MTASVTHGRALRYAEGSARGLLHHHQGRYLRLILFAVLACVAAPAVGADLRVIDGDTFDLSGQRIRLCGIDAPEMGTDAGERAKDALAAILGGSEPVRCIQVGDGTPCDGRSRKVSRGRVVAQCFVGDVDVACALVSAAAARDWPKFSGGRYRRCE